MTAPELKPCPFCGGEAVALTGPVKTLWGVTCLRCACWMDDRADTADEAVASWNRRADLAAVQPAPKALHRSFQDAGDGRPMPPMGDELMIAGLSVDDARFVAVQLAQNGLTLTAQPDPRDEVIALAITACRIIDDAVKEGYDTVNGLMMHLLEAVEPARAALAEAKAVQHG